MITLTASTLSEVYRTEGATYRAGSVLLWVHHRVVTVNHNLTVAVAEEEQADSWRLVANNEGVRLVVWLRIVEYLLSCWFGYLSNSVDA